MKRLLCFLPVIACVLTGCGSGNPAGAWPVILLLLGVLVLTLAGLRTWAFLQYRKRQQRRRKPRQVFLDQLTKYLYVAAAACLLLGLLLACLKAPEATGQPPETTEPEVLQTEPPRLIPSPAPVTEPSNWQIRWEIFQNGKLLHQYRRPESITFGEPEEYFALEGISTFRGNNYRDSATYGTAGVTEKTLTTAWTKDTGTLPGSSWSGNGWTGQPLIVRWDDATRQVMNLYPQKKEQSGLVEVIYASMDGNIYFLDLEDGSQTRDPISVGMCFKGAGSLDPRGYPLLYVGSGDANAAGQRPRMYVISLIDGSILYEHGFNETLSYRQDNDRWCAFDSAPLVSAQTDTLIWPGENGILYTLKLNSEFDKDAGTVKLRPEAPVLTRYKTDRNSTDNYWYGYEASCCIVGSYLYISENSGMFYCVDLNTMELIWAQDTRDDSNSTPVFQKAGDTQGYLYTAPSLHWTQDSNAQGTIHIYKLDAVTGQILWQKPYRVHTVSGVSGGVQSSPLLGKPGTNMEGLILYAIARTDKVDSGTLVALDTETGEEKWRLDMTSYAWSSPVAVYDESGNGYAVLCDSAGNAHFIDGASGEVLDTLYLGGLVEASPAVFEDRLVVGTRLKKICGIKIN